MSQVREVSIRIMPDLTKFTEAFARVTAAFRSCGEAMNKAAQETHWKVRIILAETEKERRLIRRDYARETRKPSLIHNGRKPR